MTHHADNLFIVTGAPGAGKTTLLDAAMRDVYTELGYRVVELPKVPVAERLAFVKDVIAHA